MDALRTEDGIARVLDALGCGTPPSFADGRNITCPSPDHPDAHPSATVRAAHASIFCQSRCGNIHMLDLIIAHGAAASRGEAARWVEDALHLTPAAGARAAVRAASPPPCDDPSLTVEQYATLKGLDAASLRATFRAEDVQTCFMDGGTEPSLTYESGWYTTTFMPSSYEGPDPVTGEVISFSARPRVRSYRPRGAVRPAGVVRHLESVAARGVRREDYSALPLGAYGLQEFVPTSAADAPALAAAILVVEGESDVQAAHLLGFTAVVGVPGARNAGAGVTSEMICHAARLAARHAQAPPRVVIWQEPGTAGAEFPGRVAAAVDEAWLRLHPGEDAPTYAALPHSNMDAGVTERWQGIKDIGDLVMRGGAGDAQITDHLRRHIYAAAQIAGPAGMVGGKLGVNSPATLPEVTGTKTVHATLPPGADDPWHDLLAIDDAPHADTVPLKVHGASRTFVRTSGGWAIVEETEEGPKEKPIARAFTVTECQNIDGEAHALLCAPHSHVGHWHEERASMAHLSSSERFAAIFASLLVTVVPRQRAAAQELAMALFELRLSLVGMRDVPRATGWVGAAGASAFGGIDAEPSGKTGIDMHAANMERSSAGDTSAQARAWWDTCIEPLLIQPAAEHIGPARAVAPLVALGCAASSPLLAPLTSCGGDVSPVVWLAGRGGGGKTVLQRACASIFAPTRATGNYFMSANVSQAALAAIAADIRDVPLILDDVTQIPAQGQVSKGDDGKIEAAAQLAMMIFNRQPLKRARQDGTIREAPEFRVTGIFSAEMSIDSASSRAKITAGERRRILTLECQPMHDRSLSVEYAEEVNVAAATQGGAAGALIAEAVRGLVHERRLAGLLARCRSALPRREATRHGSLSICLLGFAVLEHVCTARALDEIIDERAPQFAHLIDGRDADGGFTDDDATERVLRAVQQMCASNGSRLAPANADDAVGPSPAMGYIGRKVAGRGKSRGMMHYHLLPLGMAMLQSDVYGITPSMIDVAEEEGMFIRTRSFKMLGESTRGAMFIVPEEGDEEDDDGGDDPTRLAPEAKVDAAHEWSQVEAQRAASAMLGAAWDPPADGIASSSDAQADSNANETNETQTDPTSDTNAITIGDTTFTSTIEAMQQVYTWLPMLGANPPEEYMIRHVPASGLDTGDGPLVFVYDSGLYYAPDPSDTAVLHRAIRADAAREVNDLRSFYPDLPIDGVPGDDSPGWAKLDALPLESLHGFWTKAGAAGDDTCSTTLTAEQIGAAQADHAKWYRLHCLARIRRPEAFITSEDPRA